MSELSLIQCHTSTLHPTATFRFEFISNGNAKFYPYKFGSGVLSNDDVRIGEETSFLHEQDINRSMKWHYRHLALAKFYGDMNSKDPSTKVGAVIVDPFDQTIISLGFNGFARNVPDSPNLYFDRAKKYPRVIHAEMNALLTAKTSVRGKVIYTSSLPPCMRCASCIIQSGISAVVFKDALVPEHWRDEILESIDMMQTAGLIVASFPRFTLLKSELTE